MSRTVSTTLFSALSYAPVLISAAFMAISCGDPPALKWSDLRYVFDSQEGHDGKEALQG